MMTYKDLQRALRVNERLLLVAIAKKDHAREHELVRHRQVLKDTMIEAMEIMLYKQKSR